ncbi:LapA family protein [Noviherbaspirillum saxi]|uniref:LapA family protein n=2 Tax=Noviherbaspirillum saxi TaxID=2320863 RepID=A0A3A3FNZ2_9BURK|nr:LapA family protein [Noviherbaspirillum saxi]
MLGFLILVTFAFLAYVTYLQTSVILESRRHARELQSHRELADQAEASRFTELRAFIEKEMSIAANRDMESRNVLFARIDRLNESLGKSIEDSNNTVAAYVGELEDRLLGDKDTPGPKWPQRRDH